MKKLSLTFALLGLSISLEAQPSGFNYDEAKVPEYKLPDPLTTEDGKKVTSPKIWQDIRRPEIFSLFQKHVYGRSPKPSGKIHYQVFDDSLNTGNEPLQTQTS